MELILVGVKLRFPDLFFACLINSDCFEYVDEQIHMLTNVSAVSSLGAVNGRNAHRNKGGINGFFQTDVVERSNSLRWN